MSLTAVHDSLANTALIYFAILAIWGLVRFARRQGVSSNYWGALVIAELLILAQGTLGAYLWYSGLRPGRGIHILYGLVSALSIPAVYVYTKGGEERRDMLIYAVVALVTVGLILRAMTTAG
jgi:heme A synthase